MTNYLLTEKDYTLHAMGIERYNLLTEHYAESATRDGMINLMKKVKYTQIYDRKFTFGLKE